MVSGGKFKFKDRVEITHGFYKGKTGVVEHQVFKWWPLGFHYLVRSEDTERQMFFQISVFQAVVREKHLKPAKEPTIVVAGDGAVREVR